MDDIDFNIDNYDIDELIQLLNFDKVPTNEDMIVHRIDVLKRKYKSKPKYIKFFIEIGKKLILNFEHFNKETWEEQYEQDDSLSAKVLTQQYLDEKDDFKNLMLDPNRNIIGIKKLPNDQRYSTKSNTQGVRNPITINISTCNTIDKRNNKDKILALLNDDFSLYIPLNSNIMYFCNFS